LYIPELVPPISKPITGCPVSALYVVSAYPTTPPAGPDSIAREPLNLQTVKHLNLRWHQTRTIAPKFHSAANMTLTLIHEWHYQLP